MRVMRDSFCHKDFLKVCWIKNSQETALWKDGTPPQPLFSPSTNQFSFCRPCRYPAHCSLYFGLAPRFPSPDCDRVASPLTAPVAVDVRLCQMSFVPIRIKKKKRVAARSFLQLPQPEDAPHPYLIILFSEECPSSFYVAANLPRLETFS